MYYIIERMDLLKQTFHFTSMLIHMNNKLQAMVLLVNNEKISYFSTIGRLVAFFHSNASDIVFHLFFNYFRTRKKSAEKLW